MKEQEFDQKVEQAAAIFERRVEAAADRLDKTVNRAWNRSRLFRCVSRGTSLAAAWCAGLSVVGLAADILTAICFRRKRK